MALPLVAANIASLCVESVFYGIFCALFFFSLYLITRAGKGMDGPYPKPMLVFSVIIFLVVTAHWCLSAARAFQAFFVHPGGQTSAAYLSDPSQFTAIFREGLLLGLLVIGDLTIIYRLWAIWSHHRGVIVVPMILLAGLSALAVINVYKFLTPNTDLLQNPGRFVATTSVWVIALCATTFTINLYCTGMIGYKLWIAGGVARDRESISRFTFIVTVLVESLSLYTFWGIFFLIFYGLGSFLYILISDTQSQVSGIAFMILHVRVGMRRLGYSSSALAVESVDGYGRKDSNCSEE